MMVQDLIIHLVDMLVMVSLEVDIMKDLIIQQDITLEEMEQEDMEETLLEEKEEQEEQEVLEVLVHQVE